MSSIINRLLELFRYVQRGQKFREAVPLLEFTSEKPTVTKEIDERLKIIESVMAGLSPEEKEIAKKRITKMRKVKHKKAENKAEKIDTNGAGLGTQKIVSEAELSEHLERGWRVVAALPSGNVVIER